MMKSENILEREINKLRKYIKSNPEFDHIYDRDNSEIEIVNNNLVDIAIKIMDKFKSVITLVSPPMVKNTPKEEVKDVKNDITLIYNDCSGINFRVNCDIEHVENAVKEGYFKFYGKSIPLTEIIVGIDHYDTWEGIMHFMETCEKLKKMHKGSKSKQEIRVHTRND